MSSTPRLTAAEFDRLESILKADHLQESMTIDALQGLFCAIASAPAPIPQEKWLASALGEHTIANAEEEEELVDLLSRFANDTARSVAGEEGLDVLTYPVEEGEEELAVWCEGYLVGVALSDPDWFGAGDEETVDELLFPFMALSGRLKKHALEAGERWEEGEAEAKLMARARESFYDTLKEAHRYWFDSRINRTPQKREGGKVGRNEPCPCGSGKKYKACHGKG